MLINPTEKMHQLALQRLPEAGQSMGLQFVIVEASEPDQFATAFEKAHAQGAEAIHIWNGPLVFRHSAEIVELAARYNSPAIYFARQYVVDGGLMSYAPDPADNWRGAGGYVAKILGGDSPGDLPVPATDPIRPDREPQDGSGAWHYSAALNSRASRRSDRIIRASSGRSTSLFEG